MPDNTDIFYSEFKISEKKNISNALVIKPYLMLITAMKELLG